MRCRTYPSTADFERWFRETPIYGYADVILVRDALADCRSHGGFAIEIDGERTLLKAYGSQLVLVLTERSRHALMAILDEVIGQGSQQHRRGTRCRQR